MDPLAFQQMLQMQSLNAAQQWGTPLTSTGLPPPPPGDEPANIWGAGGAGANQGFWGGAAPAPNMPPPTNPQGGPLATDPISGALTAALAAGSAPGALGGPVFPAPSAPAARAQPQASKQAPPKPNQPAPTNHRGLSGSGVMRIPKKGEPGAVDRLGPPAHNQPEHQLKRLGIKPPQRSASGDGDAPDWSDAEAAAEGELAAEDAWGGKGNATWAALGSAAHAHHAKLDKKSVRVFVGSIPFEATKEIMDDLCNTVGGLMEFRFVMHTKGEKVGSHKGCGFAEYKDVHVASAAIRTLNGYMLEVERASGHGKLTRKLVFDWADDEIKKDYENRSKILKIDAQDTVGNRLDHLIQEGLVQEDELAAAVSGDDAALAALGKGGALGVAPHMLLGKGADSSAFDPATGTSNPAGTAGASKKGGGKKGGGKTLADLQAYMENYDAEKEASVSAHTGVMPPPPRQVSSAPGDDVGATGEQDPSRSAPAPPVKIGRIQLNKPGSGAGAGPDPVAQAQTQEQQELQELIRAVPKKDLALVLGAGKKRKDVGSKGVGHNPFEKVRKDRDEEEDTEYDFEEEFDESTAKRARLDNKGGASANGGTHGSVGAASAAARSKGVANGKGGGKKGVIPVPRSSGVSHEEQAAALAASAKAHKQAREEAQAAGLVNLDEDVSPGAGVQRTKLGVFGQKRQERGKPNKAVVDPTTDPWELYTINDAKRAIQFITDMGLQNQFEIYKTEKNREQRELALRGTGGGERGGAATGTAAVSGVPAGGGIPIAQSHEINHAETKWESVHHDEGAAAGASRRLWGDPAGAGEDLPVGSVGADGKNDVVPGVKLRSSSSTSSSVGVGETGLFRSPVSTTESPEVRPLNDDVVEIAVPDKFPPSIVWSDGPPSVSPFLHSSEQAASPAPRRRGVLLTTFFKPEAVRYNWARPQTSYEYMRDFYKTVTALELPTVIFHDWIQDEQEFLRGAAREFGTANNDGDAAGTGPLFSFVRVNKETLATRSANDFRFYAYKEWLNAVDSAGALRSVDTSAVDAERGAAPSRHKHFDYVFFADIKDAFFVRDPFAFMDFRWRKTGETLFVQTDCDCTVEQDPWQKYALKSCIWAGRQEKRARRPKGTGKSEGPIYSAGMWGGRRREVDGLLDCVTEELWKTHILQRGNCNMAVFHECLHAYGSSDTDEGRKRFPKLSGVKLFDNLQAHRERAKKLQDAPDGATAAPPAPAAQEPENLRENQVAETHDTVSSPDHQLIAQPFFNRYRKHAEGAIALHKTLDCAVVVEGAGGRGAVVRAEPAGENCQHQSDGSDEFTTTLSPEARAQAEAERLAKTLPPGYWFNATRQEEFVRSFVQFANAEDFRPVCEKSYADFFGQIERADRKRGVWTSEAHALVTAVMRSGVSVVLESGMANGVSTELMAHALEAVLEHKPEAFSSASHGGGGGAPRRESREKIPRVTRVDIHSFELAAFYGKKMYDKTVARFRAHGWVREGASSPSAEVAPGAPAVAAVEQSQVGTSPVLEHRRTGKVAITPVLGDSTELIPKMLDALVENAAGATSGNEAGGPPPRVGVLIDGPKKFPAYQFAKHLLESYSSVEFVAIHDTAPFWQYRYARWEPDQRLARMGVSGAERLHGDAGPAGGSGAAAGARSKKAGRGAGEWVEFASEEAQIQDVWALPPAQGPGVLMVGTGSGRKSRPPFVLETFASSWRKAVGDEMDVDEMKVAERPEGAGLTIYSRQ